MKPKNSREELRRLALTLLKTHGDNVVATAPRFADAVHSQRTLFDALAFEYLTWVANGLKPDSTFIPEPPPDTSGTKIAAATISQHERREHRRRTAEEKSAALTAADNVVDAMRSAFDMMVNGRRLGDYAWGELRAKVQHNAFDAASYLRLGTEATEHALLLHKIENYAVVSDHTTKVSEVVPEHELRRLQQEAKFQAPRLVELGMHEYSQKLVESA